MTTEPNHKALTVILAHVPSPDLDCQIFTRSWLAFSLGTLLSSVAKSFMVHAGDVANPLFSGQRKNEDASRVTAQVSDWYHGAALYCYDKFWFEVRLLWVETRDNIAPGAD
jgi:hypothetical protein